MLIIAFFMNLRYNDVRSFTNHFLKIFLLNTLKSQVTRLSNKKKNTYRAVIVTKAVKMYIIYLSYSMWICVIKVWWKRYVTKYGQKGNIVHASIQLKVVVSKQKYECCVASYINCKYLDTTTSTIVLLIIKNVLLTSIL